MFWFKIFGWKMESHPPKIKKYVLAIAPHTSNWDFAVGYCVKHIADLHPNVLVKASLFKIPLVGWFLRNMGGHPVDRSKKLNLVDQIVKMFEKNKQFIMAITPEGTRSFSSKWKTGFYYVALGAKVPIVMVGIDYSKKLVTFSNPLVPSGDADVDLESMKKYFRPLKGRYPEKGVI